MSAVWGQGRGMADPASLEIRVTGGVIRGVHEGRIRAWRGIPYSAPPVGALRFRAPRPVPRWSGVRDCSRFGAVAPQSFRGQFRGVSPEVPAGEDCLTLNVLAPGEGPGLERRGGGRPVMVFIHGGGYSTGSSRDYSGQGQGFVDEGAVVYVSFNYRLGALGYVDVTKFQTRARAFESNLGLRDQIAALQWVRRNIRAFGGDPERVTIFGESAGGNAVTTLMTTPSSRGLFARAIAQSSPADAVYSRELAARWADEFVGILRDRVSEPLASAPSDELLGSAASGDLVAAALRLQIRTPDEYPGRFCLAPVIDGSLVRERPLDAFRTGRAHRVPLIIGTNRREGSIFRGRVDILPRTPARIDALLEGAPSAAREMIRMAYPGLPARRPAADFGGDLGFWFPSVKVAEYHSRYAEVHAYRFDFAPRLLRVVGLDATHGIEMPALFGVVDTPIVRAMTAFGGAEPYARAGERMRRNWLRFVRDGELPADWTAYAVPGRWTLIIDEADRLEADPDAVQRVAWEEFMAWAAAPRGSGLHRHRRPGFRGE